MTYNGLPLHDVREIVLNLEEIRVRPVERSEEPHYQALMQTHHYLGALHKIGETLWYVTTYRSDWVALLTFPPPLGSAQFGIGGLAGISAISMTA